MSLGRVPVIISDQWQPPPGIPWREFSVLVPERNVSSIPTMLKKLENDAQRMGRLGRQFFDSQFGTTVFVDRLLMTLVSKYANLSFTPKATFWRACRAAGLREARTLGHQTRSWAAEFYLRRSLDDV